jgi:hypothetical protein
LIERPVEVKGSGEEVKIMGLEEWFYNPPLPPFHRIDPDQEGAQHLLMTLEAKVNLPNGVELYYRHPGTEDRSFLRGSVQKDDTVVARLERGGTSHMSLKWADAIPAEFVDDGLLGPEYVMDVHAPARCTRCRAEIPRFNPTGRCEERTACRARVDAEDHREKESRWVQIVRQAEPDSRYNAIQITHDLIHWADAEIKRLRDLSGSRS